MKCLCGAGPSPNWTLAAHVAYEAGDMTSHAAGPGPLVSVAKSKYRKLNGAKELLLGLRSVDYNSI